MLNTPSRDQQPGVDRGIECRQQLERMRGIAVAIALGLRSREPAAIDQ